MSIYKKLLLTMGVLQITTSMLPTPLSDLYSAATKVKNYTEQKNDALPEDKRFPLLWDSANALPPISFREFQKAAETIHSYATRLAEQKRSDSDAAQHAKRVSMKNLNAAGDYANCGTCFYLPETNKALLMNCKQVLSEDEATFVDIETKMAHPGTLFDTTFNGKELIATSKNKVATGPGTGEITLYYGISKANSK